MKKWILVLVAFFTFSSAAYAKIETVEAQGYGETYEKAVDAALADAVRQVNGMTVSTQSERAGNYIRINDKSDASGDVKGTRVQDDQNKDDSFLSNKKGNSTYTENININAAANSNHDVTVNAGQSAQINTHSAGIVKGYKVKTRDCDAKGCTVVLTIEVDKVGRKTSQASSQRDRLAIITTGNRSRSGFANTLRQEITDRIVQSQRFTVLDRSTANEKAFAQEEKMLEGRSDNAASVGQTALLADYILVINVTEAGVKTTTKVTSVDLTGEFDVTSSHRTKVTVRYSLLEAATHGIQWSDFSVFEQGGRYIETARKQISDVIADKIVNKLTPAKVVAITNGQVVINRGEAMVYDGDRFDIYSQGEQLVDPDTGEVLGAAEEKVATILITTIKDKISYGIVESGKIDSIEKGAVARLSAPLPTENKTQAAKKATTAKPKTKAKPAANEQRLGDSGGVFLK
ncbi:LPS assembly lipoprotein LptE [Jinshanibacter sp. LJY008]|uniref:LPS assembly lipoprotein LptE n=1 Tax=Limnobaculum eriocheiris TaxID=2897391 RepID=A0A9X1SJ91_9GAMM|nr:LPS assembly lipoprotein LptE [Limnobaculum eriocheiris]MCD1124611.1 LPS assembly lipoprotein LptE [Limnobaculum eriocheiris]